MPTTSEAIQELYEQEYAGSSDYQHLLNGFRENADRLLYVMKEVRRWQPRSILDVGCNRGLFGALCNWNDRRLARLVGVDILPSLLRRAENSHGYTRTVQQNVAEPFFLGETFDCVLCMEVLEHVPDPGIVVLNCLAHLTYRGNILFSTPDEQGEIDGKIHVRNYGRQGPAEFIRRVAGPDFEVFQSYLPSLFCEKPHWQGWNFVTVTHR